MVNLQTIGLCACAVAVGVMVRFPTSSLNAEKHRTVVDVLRNMSLAEWYAPDGANSSSSSSSPASPVARAAGHRPPLSMWLESAIAWAAPRGKMGFEAFHNVLEVLSFLGLFGCLNRLLRAIQGPHPTDGGAAQLAVLAFVSFDPGLMILAYDDFVRLALLCLCLSMALEGAPLRCAACLGTLLCSSPHFLCLAPVVLVFSLKSRISLPGGSFAKCMRPALVFVTVLMILTWPFICRLPTALDHLSLAFRTPFGSDRDFWTIWEAFALPAPTRGVRVCLVFLSSVLPVFRLWRTPLTERLVLTASQVLLCNYCFGWTSPQGKLLFSAMLPLSALCVLPTTQAVADVGRLILVLSANSHLVLLDRSSSSSSLPTRLSLVIAHFLLSIVLFGRLRPRGRSVSPRHKGRRGLETCFTSLLSLCSASQLLSLLSLRLIPFLSPTFLSSLLLFLLLAEVVLCL